MEFAFDQWHDAEHIPAIGLVAILVTYLAHVVSGRFSTPALTVDILGAEGVFIFVVFGGDGVTVLLDTAGLACLWIEHTATATCPSESTDTEPLDGHHPYTTDDIFAVVHILLVHTLTIVDTNLVVEHTTAVGIGEEVTRNLDTDITTTGGSLTGTVAKGRQFVDYISVTTPALCDGVGGVLVGEGALELSCAYLEFWIFAPLRIKVYKLYCGLSRTCCIGALDLSTPVEVADFAVENETGKTQVEGVRVVSFGVLSLILQHAITAEFNVLHPGWQLNGGFLLSSLHFLYLSNRLGVC